MIHEKLFFSFADEYNNNEKEALPQDILRLLKASGHGDYSGRGLHGLGKGPFIYNVSTFLRFLDPLPPYVSMFLVLKISTNWHFLTPSTLQVCTYVIYEWSLILKSLKILILASTFQTLSKTLATDQKRFFKSMNFPPKLFLSCIFHHLYNKFEMLKCCYSFCKCLKNRSPHCLLRIIQLLQKKFVQLRHWTIRE